MTLTLNGVDLDNEPDWKITKAGGQYLKGYVHPDAREDFFAAISAGSRYFTGIPIKKGSTLTKIMFGQQLDDGELPSPRSLGPVRLDDGSMFVTSAQSTSYTYADASSDMGIIVCCTVPALVDAFVGAACNNSSADQQSGIPGWTNEERVEITAASNVPASSTIIAVAASRGSLAAFERQVYDEQGNTWTLDAQYVHATDEYRVMIWRSNLTTAIGAGDWIRFAHKSGGGAGIDTSARCIGAYAFAGSLSVASVGSGASAFSSGPALNTPAGDVVVAGIALEEDDEVGGLVMDADWTPMVPFTLVDGGGPSNTEGIGAQFLIGAGASTWNATIDQTRVWAAISVAYTRSSG